jgi:hypothetical protein
LGASDFHKFIIATQENVKLKTGGIAFHEPFSLVDTESTHQKVNQAPMWLG